jgi:ribosome-associated protein
MPRPLDGSGQPYITLAQFAKAHELAESGGGAKHLVRAGGFTVNGEADDRPGRKLHHGDVVVFAGKKMTVDIK